MTTSKKIKDRKDLNLDQMIRFASIFGDPHKNKFKIIHVIDGRKKGKERKLK